KYGGVTPQALAESALKTIDFVQNMGFEELVLSIKSSDVRLNQEAHRLVAEKTMLPLHIGITEAGTAQSGKVKSAIGIGALLLDGIGDTMRVSLTGDPVEEVIFAKDILKALNLSKNSINLISCPTCGRTRVDLAKITKEIEKQIVLIEKQMKKQDVQGITVAVMGCEVNGPGEAKEADFGVACGKGKGVLFQKGEIIKTISEERISEELFALIKQKLGIEDFLV
ncbi:MAG: flavodoxin-dependent (E)-4-hydroxy-3-methylbut-2-enyl-diphosphate synthase, partial [Anaerovorax sp.]|nr:flavodoxin-dependent (E)-4-hydroxy-3-methylbut-2-enyl-diphosphate synthase [Anaerovorax sp.]